MLTSRGPPAGAHQQVPGSRHPLRNDENRICRFRASENCDKQVLGAFERGFGAPIVSPDLAEGLVDAPTPLDLYVPVRVMVCHVLDILF